MKKTAICIIVMAIMVGLCFAPIRRRVIFPVENRRFFLHDLEAISGDVSGPVSATDHAVARWDGTDGLTIQGSAVTMDDNGVLSLLDVNADVLRIRTSKTPSSGSDTGSTGQLAWDSDYIYVCTATDTWRRSSLTTWGVDYLLLETGDIILLETGDKLYLEN